MIIKTLNWKKGANYSISLDDDVTLKFIPPYIQKKKNRNTSLIIYAEQGIHGNKTITFPDNVLLNGESDEDDRELTKKPLSVDVIVLYYDKYWKQYYATLCKDLR